MSRYLIINREKAVRITDTIDNKPNIEGKYQTSERTIVYHNNKIFDISIYTSEIILQDEVDFVWNNFKFID